MRLRHIPGSEEEIANSPYVIQSPEEKRGHWNEIFGNDNPIEIEVGMEMCIRDSGCFITSFCLLSHGKCSERYCDTYD